MHEELQPLCHDNQVEGGDHRKGSGRKLTRRLDSLERANADLVNLLESNRALLRATTDAVWRTSPDGAVELEFHSSGAFPHQNEAGEAWHNLIHPEDRERILSAWHERISIRAPFELDHRTIAADGTSRVLLSRWVPVLGPGGEVREWIGASTDVTEGKRAEQRQKLLLAELQRRVKNILSVVRSVTQRTIQTSSSLAAFSEHFDGRIAALARAQTIAIRTPDSGVDLAELISEEVLCGGARDGEQVTLDGPTIRLTHKAAETLALAFHELATNAVKFGALAVSGGRVAVRWRIVGEEGARRLGLTWRETVTGISEPDPTRRGFGRELIERQLPYELEAETAFDLVPDGILCTINLPLSDKVVVQDGAPAPSRGEA